MTITPLHIQALEEIEQAGIPGLVEMLRKDGLDGVRYALWDTASWHRDYFPLPGGAGPPPSRSA